MARVMIPHVRVARGWLGRTIGLMGRFHVRTRLWIPDCSAVHTWFVLTPIDIIFLDRLGLIVGIEREVSPFRLVVGGHGASSVLEAEPGFADSFGLAEGMGVDWE